MLLQRPQLQQRSRRLELAQGEQARRARCRRSEQEGLRRSEQEGPFDSSAWNGMGVRTATAQQLALVVLTHLIIMPSEHPFMLEIDSQPLMKMPCSPPRTIPAFGRLARKWWLHKLNGQRQHRQHFSTLQAVGGLRAVSVGSGRAFAEAPQLRLSCAAVQVLLVVARGSTSSRPHSGCTQGIHMVGSFGVAYLALSARIKQVRVMPLQSGEARWPRRWHDLQRQCLYRL